MVSWWGRLSYSDTFFSYIQPTPDDLPICLSMTIEADNICSISIKGGTWGKICVATINLKCCNTSNLWMSLHIFFFKSLEYVFIGLSWFRVKVAFTNISLRRHGNAGNNQIHIFSLPKFIKGPKLAHLIHMLWLNMCWILAGCIVVKSFWNTFMY